MQIIVDGKPAAIKKGSSFDFIAENRLFSGSDSYTLNITFPLRGCQQNEAIFGYLYRPDMSPLDVEFDCEIRERNFTRVGHVVITEFSESEVKAQFLEGRAHQNFAKHFDEKYVNELTLDNMFDFPGNDGTPEWAWNPLSTGYKAVALPWVSNDSGIDHNFASYDESSGKYSWNENNQGDTWMPYLLYLTQCICSAVGYSFDPGEWQDNECLSKLVVCNVVPSAWDTQNYAICLPHWTIAEFFEKLELFLNGEFEIDHIEKSISFRFSKSAMMDIDPVRIDDVVDQFSASVSEDDDCGYLETAPKKYKSDHEMMKYLSCEWFVKKLEDMDYRAKNVIEYDSVDAMLRQLSGTLSEGSTGNKRNTPFAKVQYASDADRYFILRAVSKTKEESQVGSMTIENYRTKFILQPINDCAEMKDSESDDSAEELNIVPACVDYTDEVFGYAVFSNFGSMSDNSESESIKTGWERIIESGDNDNTNEYFGVIYVAYYDGIYKKGKLPHPVVSPVFVVPDPVRADILTDSEKWVLRNPVDLRLSADNPHRTPLYNPDKKRKFSFSFISDNIPNPRALFFIKGRRYICEKITATFTDDGMSQLLKGEFWPLLDD